MADLKVRHLVVGAVATNCYITENKKTKEALIIDPGDNAARIVSDHQRGWRCSGGCAFDTWTF